MDCHSGTIDNHVGQSPFMPRNRVDDNCNNTCSNGLHFASLNYLRHFSGERLMVLKINPKHVVSIPADYEATKGRCEGYEVISEMEMPDDFKALENHWGSLYQEETDRDDEDYGDEMDDDSDVESYDDEDDYETADDAKNQADAGYFANDGCGRYQDESATYYADTVYRDYQEDLEDSYSNDGICVFAL
jgi:hypothetical protein